MGVHIATIQVVVPDTFTDGNGKEHDVCPEDWIADTLRDCFLDWVYLKVGEQYLYPVHRPHIDHRYYKEGDAFRE